jgi:uncharacterized protein (TIGR02246 family)
MTNSSESKAVIERYMAAISGGDVAAVRSSFAPDATWWLRGELPISGTWRGRDAIMDDFFDTAMSYYEAGSVSIEVTSILADGEHVAAEWTSRARTTDGAPREPLRRVVPRARRPHPVGPRVHGHRLRRRGGLRACGQPYLKMPGGPVAARAHKREAAAHAHTEGH